jgi:hypothetical protein
MIVLLDGGPIMELSSIFSNPAWKFSQAIAYPNQLSRFDHNGTTIGAVVVLRPDGGRGQDFALGTAGMKYLLQAEQEGRWIPGICATFQRDNLPRHF